MSITGILTAAGLSTRMGAPKALLPWRNTTLIKHQIGCLLGGGCDHVVVILGHECMDISREIETGFPAGAPITMVCNIEYELGRATSIKEGILSAPFYSSGFLLIAVDQPTENHIVSRIIEEHGSVDAFITSPRYKGQGGHPVLFSSKLKPELLNIDDDTQGLKPVFENYRSVLNRIDFDTPLVRLDLNDYETYLKNYNLFS